MKNKKPAPVYLKDYRPPTYLIETVELYFDLRDEWTTVRSKLSILRNHEEPGGTAPLVLDGRDLELVSVTVDGRLLVPADYELLPEKLVIQEVPRQFELAVETRIRPQDNTSLEGLYRSAGMFCTQCEAQGFRKITYFIDRPDIMARYLVTIEADRRKFPVLLANGNLLEMGRLAGGRHFARWEDPYPKSSYLFALVAGDLAKIEDVFTTRSGRRVDLRIYVEHHNRDKCDHAMQSLQKAMAWDEEVYGLEYDLDLYMIVAVDDFNMGAMENKGLNVFNSKYVLARPDTATDSDYDGIEAVIGHEYFHNWTGNRVTCRDWFQLSLKEGLTVFRDQEFSADMSSRAVKRIGDVRMLRNRQFPEDSGPMAHPVRPESYIEINNFYTLTVYEKGAEIIRMIHTLIGAHGFRDGLMLYLNRHDGQAATTDDFVRAMEDANGIDLGQFRLWYSQAGIPELTVRTIYDPSAKTYTLQVIQSCPATPGQPHKKPLHIPMSMGLLDAAGKEIPLQLDGEGREELQTSRVLELRGTEEIFRFVNVGSRPVPSLLRNFSAPVKLRYEYSATDLALLLTHDPDPFCRWEAGQRLALDLMIPFVAAWQQGEELILPPDFITVYEKVIKDDALQDNDFKALLLTLPSEEYLGELLAVIDVDAVHGVRELVRLAIARGLRDNFLETYHGCSDGKPYRFEPLGVARRHLKNLCLSYLMTQEDPHATSLCIGQFQDTDNMTDRLAALQSLVHAGCPERLDALATFEAAWRQDVLVMDKWFAIQATAPLARTLDEVKRLMDHPVFSLTNPNRVRALIGSFCGGNPVAFHDRSGAGYQFLADVVLALDPLNPQIAARLLQNLSRWRRYDNARQELMKKELERISGSLKLSNDVYEVAAKSLG